MIINDLKRKYDLAVYVLVNNLLLAMFIFASYFSQRNTQMVSRNIKTRSGATNPLQIYIQARKHLSRLSRGEFQ